MKGVGNRRRFDTAEERWAGVGPYYAMFPNAFAKHIVGKYSAPGDCILDPFAGRGTTPFWAAALDREAVSVEINPVGWVYTKSKVSTASRQDVEARMQHLVAQSWRYRAAADRLPPFFHACYSDRVRAFLLCARRQLMWRKNKIDWTTMSLLLVHLHGKNSDSLSNQMRQTKSLSPDYALRWWRERGLNPPEIDPLEFFGKKLDWRYARGVPTVRTPSVYLGDSCTRLTQIAGRVRDGKQQRASLLFTSPPYCGVTNYHYDQWIRLWLLGGPEHPCAQVDKTRGKFCDRTWYRSMLETVFTRCKPLLRKEAVIYVRTDSRALTLNITREVLTSVFAGKRVRRLHRPLEGASQTTLFGGKATGDGEVDLVLT